MTNVINLVGASGSGKTTIAKRLENHECNVIHSYTTRKPREEGEWGHTFITTKDGFVLGGDFYGYHIEVSDAFKIPNLIAYFNSYKSGNHYFATDDQVLRGKNNIYVVDPLGAEMVHDYYKDNDNINVITIYLMADENIRAERISERLNLNDRKIFEYKDVPAVWERIYQDRKIFSKIKCDYVLNANRKIDTVVNDVLEIIKGEDI